MVARRGQVEYRINAMKRQRDQGAKELEGIATSDGAIRDLDQGA